MDIDEMIRYLTKQGYTSQMLRILTTSQLQSLYYAKKYLENKEN